MEDDDCMVNYFLIFTDRRNFSIRLVFSLQIVESVNHRRPGLFGGSRKVGEGDEKEEEEKKSAADLFCGIQIWLL